MLSDLGMTGILVCITSVFRLVYLLRSNAPAVENECIASAMWLAALHEPRGQRGWLSGCRPERRETLGANLELFVCFRAEFLGWDPWNPRPLPGARHLRRADTVTSVTESIPFGQR